MTREELVCVRVCLSVGLWETSEEHENLERGLGAYGWVGAGGCGEQDIRHQRESARACVRVRARESERARERERDQALARA